MASMAPGARRSERSPAFFPAQPARALWRRAWSRRPAAGAAPFPASARISEPGQRRGVASVAELAVPLRRMTARRLVRRPTAGRCNRSLQLPSTRNPDLTPQSSPLHCRGNPTVCQAVHGGWRTRLWVGGAGGSRGAAAWVRCRAPALRCRAPAWDTPELSGLLGSCACALQRRVNSDSRGISGPRLPLLHHRRPWELFRAQCTLAFTKMSSQ